MIREWAKVIAFSAVGISLILSLLRFGGMFDIAWWIILAPLWMPLVLLILPWVITVALLWIHQKTRGE